MSAFVQLLSCLGSLITQTALGTETLQNIEDIKREKRLCSTCGTPCATLFATRKQNTVGEIDKMKVFTAMSVRVAKSLFVVKG